MNRANNNMRLMIVVVITIIIITVISSCMQNPEKSNLKILSVPNGILSEAQDDIKYRKNLSPEEKQDRFDEIELYRQESVDHD